MKVLAYSNHLLGHLEQLGQLLDLIVCLIVANSNSNLHHLPVTIIPLLDSLFLTFVLLYGVMIATFVRLFS